MKLPWIDSTPKYRWDDSEKHFIILSGKYKNEKFSVEAGRIIDNSMELIYDLSLVKNKKFLEEPSFYKILENIVKDFVKTGDINIDRYESIN
jgi:hypothetical protein